MRFAPASAATALASSVFPVPGGPKSSIPRLQGFLNCPFEKSSGLRSGRITDSLSASFTSSRPPTSSKPTRSSSGGTTSSRSFFSNTFAVTTTSFSDFFGLSSPLLMASNRSKPCLMLSLERTSPASGFLLSRWCITA
ncbi:uncharacterized protein M6B38_306575 [Iris pallida]|uniref:Secreted protein n=1 Tax=Iris pallida TaxID=29817 RepID=A0AAX6HLB6_IRIPA|nr:uncharacterized protein M6B38_306575 [Iris pallida]